MGCIGYNTSLLNTWSVCGLVTHPGTSRGKWGHDFHRPPALGLSRKPHPWTARVNRSVPTLVLQLTRRSLFPDPLEN